MIQKVLKPLYHFTHDILFKTIDYNPLFSNIYQERKIKKGHISTEHLQQPVLDKTVVNELEKLAIPVHTHTINKLAYQQYITQANYPATYYGGGLNPEDNFIEKTLEHYVSTEFIDFSESTTFIDIAACTSPFYQIVKKVFGVKTSYQQDLIFKKGLHGDKIGGFASQIPLPDESVDAVTLHCSLEHFEGQSDIEFFQEMERVLKRGGKIVILPFYLAYEYTIHVDPIYNLIKRHQPILDPTARLRYCNWYQFFSRHYSAKKLQERILQNTPNLQLTVHQVNNFKEIDESCYLRFVGVFTKV